MHMMINISLNLLIGTLIYTKNFIVKFIMKTTVWLFIDKNTHLLIVMDFWSQKIKIGHLIQTSQNEKYILIHIPNLLLGLNIWWNRKWQIHMMNLFFENFNHLIVSDFEWFKFDHIFISPYELQFFFVFFFFGPKNICFGTFKISHYSYGFCEFSFQDFQVLKNNISYIKYKFSHRFGKICRWLSMYYSKIRIMTFFKATNVSIWIILKNLVWIRKDYDFYHFWAIPLCIHPRKEKKFGTQMHTNSF
jgi:hypothetical protein